MMYTPKSENKQKVSSSKRDRFFVVGNGQCFENSIITNNRVIAKTKVTTMPTPILPTDNPGDPPSDNPLEFSINDLHGDDDDIEPDPENNNNKNNNNDDIGNLTNESTAVNDDNDETQGDRGQRRSGRTSATTKSSTKPKVPKKTETPKTGKRVETKKPKIDKAAPTEDDIPLSHLRHIGKKAHFTSKNGFKNVISDWIPSLTKFQSIFRFYYGRKVKNAIFLGDEKITDAANKLDYAFFNKMETRDDVKAAIDKYYDDAIVFLKKVKTNLSFAAKKGPYWDNLVEAIEMSEVYYVAKQITIDEATKKAEIQDSTLEESTIEESTQVPSGKRRITSTETSQTKKQRTEAPQDNDELVS